LILPVHKEGTKFTPFKLASDSRASERKDFDCKTEERMRTEEMRRNEEKTKQE